jgi:RNA polymerase sigma-70 factor (ECF subfamily)
VVVFNLHPVLQSDLFFEQIMRRTKKKLNQPGFPAPEKKYRLLRTKMYINTLYTLIKRSKSVIDALTKYIRNDMQAIEGKMEFTAISTQFFNDKNNEEHFARFVLKTVGEMRFISPLIRDDIAQETFIKLNRAIDKGKLEAGRIRTAHIRLIAKNIHIDFLRKKMLREDACVEITDYNSECSVDGCKYNHDRLTILQVAQVDLPLIEKDVIGLLLEGFEQKEIAEKLGIPPGTVRRRLHTARKKLKKIFYDND